MSSECEQTHQKLRLELEAAIERRDKASAEFDQVIREIPSGLPQQEGHYRILRASRDYSAAQAAVTDALVALNNFLEVKSSKTPPDKKKDRTD